jgi:uncharacterized protein (DUF302 family)
MDYSFRTTVNAPFDKALGLTIDALKAEGFGIVSQIELDKKFVDAFGKEFKHYTILGACIPAYAYQAVNLEELIGLLLPCNVVVIDREDGTTLVATINPLVTMRAVENQALETLAVDIAAKLQKVVDGL